MLTVTNLVTGYGADPIIRGVSFHVAPQSILAVFGHNGAGKSSVVRVLVGLIPVWQGQILINGRDVTNMASSERVRSGIAVSFQDDCVFPSLSVRKNLEIGGYVLGNNKKQLEERLETVIQLFPRIRERLKQQAYSLSGGERRMLSIAQAMMSDPKLLVLDEPSTGLSPAMTERVLGIITTIRDKLGKSIVLVEQNVGHALDHCDDVIVLKTGEVVYSGVPSSLSSNSAELIHLF